MRTRINVSVLAVLFVALTVAATVVADEPREVMTSPQPQAELSFDDHGLFLGHLSFGRRIAGVWMGTLEIPGVLPPAPFITTYSDDGTAQTSSNNPLSSTHHLTWKRSGWREIQWRILHFTFDADGAIATISRTSGVQEYDRGFRSFAGEFWVEICLPDPETGFDNLLANPNDPNACIIPPLPTGIIQGAKLKVEIP